MSRLASILASHVAQGPDTTNRLLGAAFALLDTNGHILHQSSSGRTALSPTSPPYNPSTITWIASLTKLITAVSILQLVESDLVTLDQDVRPLHPALAALKVLKGIDSSGSPVLEENTRAITLRQLLTHTSGANYDLMEPDVQIWSQSVGRTANAISWSVEGFSTPFVFPPGEGWRYGASVDWAGLVLEKITGMTLGQYFEEKIFKPLGMSDTTFWPDRRADLKDRMAAFTLRPVSADGKGEPVVEVPSITPERHEVESGGAGLYSCMGDYVKFMAGLLQGRLLKEETRRLLFEPQLSGVQKEMMVKYVGLMHDVFAPEFPEGLDIDFGFGGMLNLEDVPGRRRKESVMWSGMANSHWVSDAVKTGGEDWG